MQTIEGREGMRRPASAAGRHRAERRARVVATALLALPCGCAAVGAAEGGAIVEARVQPRNKLVYDGDEREDPGWLQLIARQTDAVAILVSEASAHLAQDGTITLKTKSLRERHNTCPGTRFEDQPTVESACTGFLVREDVLATALHCVSGERWKNRLAVFGYGVRGGHARTSFSPDKAYRVKRVLPPSQQPAPGDDWALLELEQRVQDVEPLAVAQADDLRESDRLYMIGYPVGLPVKYAGGAVVLSTEPRFFRASLDASKGNSGSPVFTTRGEVVGMLVDGGRDFEWDGNCRRERRCGPTCPGEIVQRSSSFVSSIPH